MPNENIEQRVFALSAMGRPVVLTANDRAEATTRVMLISGHRSMTRPVTAIAPAVFAKVASDPENVVALASIEDINPDGAYSPRRETVLGIDVATDHGACRAAETRALQSALAQWKTTVVVDVAERPADPDSPIDVEVVVRFVPTPGGDAPEAAAQLGRRIRTLLDQSSGAYSVSLVGCTPGSLTATYALPVVELTTHDSTDARLLQALIEATAATYRAAADTRQLVPTHA